MNPIVISLALICSGRLQLKWMTPVLIVLLSGLSASVVVQATYTALDSDEKGCLCRFVLNSSGLDSEDTGPQDLNNDELTLTRLGVEDPRFDIDLFTGPGGAEYTRLIDYLRQHFTIGDRNGVFVLNNAATGATVIVLTRTHNGQTIPVSIVIENRSLYIIGFIVGLTYYEFPDHQDVFNYRERGRDLNRYPLAFESNYPAVYGQANIPLGGNFPLDLDDLTLPLFDYRPPNYQGTVAGAILRLIVVTSEAVRFNVIENHVRNAFLSEHPRFLMATASAFPNARGSPIGDLRPANFWWLVHTWGPLSEAAETVPHVGRVEVNHRGVNVFLNQLDIIKVLSLGTFACFRRYPHRLTSAITDDPHDLPFQCFDKEQMNTFRIDRGIWDKTAVGGMFIILH